MPVKGRGLGSRQTQDVGKDGRLGNLSTPGKCSVTTDGVTGKCEGIANLSFLCLYDKLHWEDSEPGCQPLACRAFVG
jgi:hypothetical protein